MIPASAGAGLLVGKNISTSILLFSSLVVALHSDSPDCFLSTGILELLPSAAIAEMYLCAIQMSGSSAFSSQSLQWCHLFFSILDAYFLLASSYSACNWLFERFPSLLTFLPSHLAFLRRSVSSFIHHLFNVGLISLQGTSLSIVSCRALVSLAHFSSKQVWFLISWGSPIFVSSPLRPILNFSQSMSLKFVTILVRVCFIIRLRTVRIGRWSVHMPGVCC